MSCVSTVSYMYELPREPHRVFLTQFLFQLYTLLLWLHTRSFSSSLWHCRRCGEVPHGGSSTALTALMSHVGLATLATTCRSASIYTYFGRLLSKHEGPGKVAPHGGPGIVSGGTREGLGCYMYCANTSTVATAIARDTVGMGPRAPESFTGL